MVLAVCSGCTKKMFAEITFSGTVYDIYTSKPLEGVRVRIYTCTSNSAKDFCDQSLIASAVTNASGYYQVKERASKSTRYFFYVETDEFSRAAVGMQPFVEAYAKEKQKEFKNDFVIGMMKHWHKVHIKNVNPVNAQDEIVLKGTGRTDPKTVLRGMGIDTTIVFKISYSECCTDKAELMGGLHYWFTKNGKTIYPVDGKPGIPRDTISYDLFY